MTPIADSNAVRDRDRVLPQHQAALTLLQARLSTPGATQVRWLDLACGRGQILASLDANLSYQARSKLEYWAYDLNSDYSRETMRTAQILGFASLECRVGDLANFTHLLPADTRFDFITLTNTVHEFEPSQLAKLLVDALSRLTDSGTLFIYDMERIVPPELGAVPWTRDEIRGIVFCILDALGASQYRPEVGLWFHRTTNGWNVQLQREHLGILQDAMAERLETAVAAGTRAIAAALSRRLSECRKALETLTRYGAATAEEEDDKQRLLFEFWALSRALGDEQ